MIDADYSPPNNRMKLKEMKRYKRLIIPSALIFLLIIPSVMGAFPLDCSYQCSANDVQITGAQISDQEGNDLPCRFCEPGNPASAYLALTIFNNAEAARYNIYVIYTLSLGGIDQTRTFSCLAASLGGRQTIKAEIPVSWTCGQSVNLKDIIVTWSTEPNENTCDIPRNCHAPGKSWCTPLLSVKTPLVAAFTSNSPQCICVPQSCQPIQFTDQTTGGSGTYNYQWDLGDGSTSTQKNPLKQYSAPGVYQVTVTVSDGACSDSHSGQITVYPAPSASFTSLPGICLGADLQFTDTSTPGTAPGITPASIVKWEWDFGDGSAHSLDRNPVHRYLSAGNYQVTLKVTDSRGCTASITSSVQVRANPVPTFTVDPATLCFRPGLSTAFHGQATQGSGPYSFAWDYGDGSTGFGSDPTHQYANQGTYNVKLTVTDNNGCTGTTTAQVTIVDCDPPGIDDVTVFTGPICSGLKQVVDAHVVDYVGVASVTLNYQVDGGAVTQKAMTFVAGSGSVKDGKWTAEVPGQAAGSTVTYWITAYDGTFTSQSAHYSISYIDCTPPAITSVKASTFTPCAGSDVLITAHATAGPGVSSVTIDYDGSSHPMSGPAGSTSGDWTYSVPGFGKVAGDSLTFTISATDALGRIVHSSSFTITWRDCTPPEIISITPSDLSPCPPADVTITARITDDVGVVSAFLTYDGVDHPMSGLSPSGDWTATITGAGRSAGDFVDYRVKASDAAGNTVTSEIGKITWRDCNAPVIQSITPSTDAPCGGDDVSIVAIITDNTDVKSANLVIDNTPYGMSETGAPNEWSYTITPGMAAGQSISYYVSAEDDEGNTATSSTFKLTWKDCTEPAIGTAVLEPASPCAGADVFVKVHITDNVGVTAATITYDGTSYQMSGPIGPANDGDWTANIIGAGKKAGDSITYTITAEDAAENAATPVTGSITWIDCTPPVVQSVDTSSSTPCAGTDVTITAHVTDDVGVASVDLYYDSTHHAMVGPVGSKDGDWTITIAGRPAGTSLSYTVIASDGPNPSSPASGVILWKDCSNPDLAGPDIVSITPSSATPCAGTDVLITAHLEDEHGVASAELVYDGTSQPMSGISGEKYWTASIPGAGKLPGSSLSYKIQARDTLGNQAVSGEFTLTWKDCSHPEIGSIALSPHEPCAGKDVTVTVQITDNIGVASATLTAGGTDYLMTGPTGSTSGEWMATIPGAGIAAGYVLTFSISASDAAGNKATPATGQIHWRDCAIPEIQSIIPSNSQPCAGEDVTVTARILDDHNVASATLNYDSSAIPMSGPVGSPSGDWTATIPGSARQAGEIISYYITAKDGSGTTAVSESQTISWQDCMPPQISEISPGDIKTCEGNGDLQITARIAATAGVVSARIIYEEEGDPGLYQVEMTRQGSDPKDSIWSGAISKRKVRTITYYITASTGKYTATSQSYRAIFDECDVPELIDHEITAPCAGNDAQVSFTIRDEDQDFYEAVITYEGKEYPLHLLGNDPYPLEGVWTGTIPGAGRQPGETLSISLNGYTLDTQGPNPPEGLGQFTVTWLDCRPGITLLTPGSAEVCAGKDQVITARATSGVGISSMVIHYTDSSGQYETSMQFDQGSSLWTGLILDQTAGTIVEYYIEATSTNGDISRMPQQDSYRLTWLDCSPGILSVTPGTIGVCSGNDQIIRARATSPVGVSSIMLYYTDSAGQSFETSMVMDEGADPKDASWTGLIPNYPVGSTVDYYIVATSFNGDVSKKPLDGSYRLTWVICKAELNKTASSSTVAPGGTITYTVTYRNSDSNDISDVVITESYPPGTIFISASPPPDSGTDNRWTIGYLPAGASGTITIIVRAPDESKIKFFMEQSAKGLGFVRTYKDLNTGREPQVLTNQVSMTGRGISGQFAISRVTISGEAGTTLATRESGSGSYSREEELRYLRENRSIKDISNLSVSYQATKFQLPGSESINYTSKWTDREKAKNYVTAESVEESYRYATKINKESQIELDRNGTNMTADSEFEGMRHAGYFKASKPDDKGRVSPLMEMSSDYAGSFRVKERLGTTYSNRSNAITTVKHYEMPHITIYQKGERYNMSDPKIYYTISILNDGNQTLGPIYLTDLFPAGMMFFDASAHPSEELLPDADHANWTFTSLPIGKSLTLYLTLMWYVVIEPPVNWVFVKAGHDGTWITANNSTLSNLNWLSGMPTSKPAGIQQKMITGDWNPPEWGLDQSPDICTSCAYSPPP